MVELNSIVQASEVRKRGKSAMYYEDILYHIGHFGKYQKLTILALCLIQFPTAFHFIAQVFLAANTDHWCTVPGSEAVNCSQLQRGSSACQEAQKNKSIPYELKLDSDGKRVYSSCERYATDEDISGEFGPNSTDIVACDAGWDFDRSRYKSTINEEFSLVCDREDLAGISSSVWFAGLLAGSLVWGSVGDWLGRKTTFFLSLGLVSISSIVTTFVPNFEAFTAMRFFTAACSYGSFLMVFIVSSEMVGPQKRALVGSVVNVFFAIGYVILSVLAFLIREWRHLQLAISLPYLLFFLFLIFMPESPRWLISKGRFEEAKKVIKKIAKVNGKKVPENLFDNLESLQEDKQPSRHVHTPTQLDLFRTPNLRKKTLILFFGWFVANMAYYGLSLSTSDLGIDDYLAAFVSGAIEVPSYFFCWIVMARYGRRLTLAALFGSGGLFCLVTIFIPLGAARVAVAMMGKFAVAAAFNHIYIYSGELYPTVVRSMGMGMSSMSARVSGILCPIILILGKYWEPLPLVVFGGGSVMAGLLSLLLPETLGCKLPDTLEEGEEFGKGLGRRFCHEGSSQDSDDSAKPPVDYVPLATCDKSASGPAAV